MTLFSGKFPRNHGGKYWLVSMLLPCRGGMHSTSRRQRPAATSTSLRLRRFRWRAGIHRFWLANQASAAGLVRASCDSLKEFAGKLGCAGVSEDQPGEVTGIGGVILL